MKMRRTVGGGAGDMLYVRWADGACVSNGRERSSALARTKREHTRTHAWRRRVQYNGKPTTTASTTQATTTATIASLSRADRECDAAGRGKHRRRVRVCECVCMVFTHTCNQYISVAVCVCVSICVMYNVHERATNTQNNALYARTRAVFKSHTDAPQNNAR